MNAWSVRHWRIVVLLFWISYALYAIFDRWAQIRGFALGDTDDNLRLAQVRALLGGQGWYDLVQHRLDPVHGGADIHWSRLVDLPIAGLTLALRPLLGGPEAERWAAAIAPCSPSCQCCSGSHSSPAGWSIPRRATGPRHFAVRGLDHRHDPAAAYRPSRLAARLPQPRARRDGRPQPPPGRGHARPRQRGIARHRARTAHLSRPAGHGGRCCCGSPIASSATASWPMRSACRAGPRSASSCSRHTPIAPRCATR